MTTIRKWINLFESSIKEVNVDEDYGSIEGYVVSTTEEQLENWLKYRHNIENNDILENIRSEYSIIAMINNLNVNEDYRNQGYGNNLLGEFIDKCSDLNAEAIILISDTNEENSFDLTQWYERNGFNILLHSSSGPLMILDLR